MLTDIDRDLIWQQCVIQNATSPEEVANFTAAYEYAKNFAQTKDFSSFTTDEVLELLHKLMIRTEPSTGGKPRIVPATFASLEKGLDSRLIEHTARNFAEAFAGDRVSPEWLYKELEEIHPGNDGNGRVGHCLWAIHVTRKTGNWPETLPPILFGEGADKVQYESAFGEIDS